MQLETSSKFHRNLHKTVLAVLSNKNRTSCQLDGIVPVSEESVFVSECFPGETHPPGGSSSLVVVRFPKQPWVTSEGSE